MTKVIRDYNLNEYEPKVLPASWVQVRPNSGLIGEFGFGVRIYTNHKLHVILSIDKFGKAGQWLHVSVSNAVAPVLPTWMELKEVKELFLGDRLAVQILPPKKYYINEAEAFHLMSRLDEVTIPDEVWKQDF